MIMAPRRYSNAGWLAVVTMLLICGAGYAGTDALSLESTTVQIGELQYRVRAPAGYRLEMLTDKLAGPRLFTFDSNGDLLLGSKGGYVYRLRPPYHSPETLLSLASYPHSVARRGSDLLIAQQDGLYRVPYQPGQEQIAIRDVELMAKLPAGSGHSSRTVAVGPDRRIYVSLGISGNCSDQYLDDSYPFHERRGGIMWLDESAQPPRWRTYASGFRNPVGFDWRPGQNIMYASNNGPDHHGFEWPPEYFSRVDAGSFHGMPWFQYDGERIKRDDCIKRPSPRPISEVTKPVATFPARNAPMAVAFISSTFTDYHMVGDAVVALHGSWGTSPTGGFIGDPASRREPKLVLVRFNQQGEAARVDDLLTGFQLANGQRWARPVGVGVGPDGAIYFTSDSGANALFRLSPVPD